MRSILNRYFAQSINNSANTTLAYSSDLNIVLRDVTRNMSYDSEEDMYSKISIEAIESLFTTYRGNLSKKTINRRINACRGYGEYLVNLGIWSRNKFNTLLLYSRIIEGEDTRIYYTPTQDEILKIIDNTYSDKNKLRAARTRFIISLMTTTGLRINSLLSITFDHLEYIDGAIMINFSGKEMKNHKGCRIPICGKTLDYYLEYKKERDKLETNLSLLILSDKGSKMKSKVVCDNIKRYAKFLEKDNFDNLVNHSFREAFRTIGSSKNFNRDLLFLIGDWELDKVSRVYVKDGKHLDEAKINICSNII